MLHCFDPVVAAEVGMASAVILQNIYYWTEKNRANDVHFHEGRYWTYNSVEAFRKMFPYLTAKQIRTAISKLKDAGYILSDHFNKVGFDRTTWYAISDAGYALLDGVVPDHEGHIELPEKENVIAPEGKSELPQRANQNCPRGRTNTKYKPNINSNINSSNPPISPKGEEGEESEIPNEKPKEKPKRKRAVFLPPTPEEVDAYCRGRNNGITGEEFVAFYASKGWMVGKNKMADWKAAVRTWEIKRKKENPQKDQPEEIYGWGAC